MPNLSDEELQKLSDDFARLNLQDRDDVVFDFEVDIKRIIKKLDVQKITNKKYRKKVRNFIMAIILKAYLKDIMLVGIKKLTGTKNIMAEVRVNLQGLNKLRKDLPAFMDDVSKSVANQAPTEITENALAGLTGIFPGSKLPKNKPSTIKKKGHDQQLIDKGILLQERLWKTRKTTKGYVVVPPPLRREVVKHLNERTQHRPAYKIMDIPFGSVPKWVKTLTVKRFNKFLKKYQ